MSSNLLIAGWLLEATSALATYGIPCSPNGLHLTVYLKWFTSFNEYEMIISCHIMKYELSLESL